MRVLKDERGQVMVLTVLCMAVLIGFVALAIDVGLLLRAKGVMQTAADSAAIAGAAELSYGDVQTAAWTDAAQNGVTNGVNGTVTVHIGPQSGPFTGDPNYVEVIVSQPQPTFFLRAFESLAGFGQNNFMTVSARAVATPIPTPSCIYTLSQGPVGGFEGISVTSPSGSAGSLTAPKCGVLDNGADSSAVTAGSNATIIAEAIGVVGGVSNQGTISPAPVTGITPVSDPLTALQPPAYDPAACLPDPQITGGSTQNFGAVAGGTVCYNGLTVNGGIKTLNPGVYVINGPMVFGGGVIQGTDVTIYFTPGAGGSFTDTSGDQVNLSAPTSGPYKDILFYQDPLDTNTMAFTPNDTWTLNGIIYLPGANLSIAGGSSSSSFIVDLVVGSFSFTSTSTGPALGLTPYVPLESPAPIAVPRMAE